MKERLLEFLRTENKSSAQLAEEIGVQPSGISHILSGRNNPSLDFVLKMLEKYPYLSTDWLLFGKGSMYKDKQMQSLFDDAATADNKPGTGSFPEEPFRQIPESNSIYKDRVGMQVSDDEKKETSSLSGIVMFYDDGSFKEYLPRS